jgi:hypothetical protein
MEADCVAGRDVSVVDGNGVRLDVGFMVVGAVGAFTAGTVVCGPLEEAFNVSALQPTFVVMATASRDSEMAATFALLHIVCTFCSPYASVARSAAAPVSRSGPSAASFSTLATVAGKCDQHELAAHTHAFCIG